jgi:hypothetical protein
VCRVLGVVWIGRFVRGVGGAGRVGGETISVVRRGPVGDEARRLVGKKWLRWIFFNNTETNTETIIIGGVKY